MHWWCATYKWISITELLKSGGFNIMNVNKMLSHSYPSLLFKHCVKFHVFLTLGHHSYILPSTPNSCKCQFILTSINSHWGNPPSPQLSCSSCLLSKRPGYILQLSSKLASLKTFTLSRVHFDLTNCIVTGMRAIIYHHKVAWGNKKLIKQSKEHYYRYCTYTHIPCALKYNVKHRYNSTLL
jgi:hypothetical protein